MTLAQVRKVLVHACEARRVVVTFEDFVPTESRAEFRCLTLDRNDVTVKVSRCPKDPDSWIFESEHGTWSAGNYPDCVAHATAAALGDKEDAA